MDSETPARATGAWHPLASGTGVVLFALVGARLAWSVPWPLITTLAVAYALWASALICGTWLGGSRISLAALLGGWLASTSLGLAALHQWDRGGWTWYRATGYDLVIADDLREEVHQSAAEFTQRHPQFHIDPHNPNRVVLPRGKHVFDQTVVVPEGNSLRIQPGAVLRFGAGRSLVSYGPIHARGTEAEPIRFTSASPWHKWGVVAVIDADRSVFEHVLIEHGRWARVNGVYLPGQLSLIDSDTSIRHARFQDAYGKDAVYARDAKVVVWASQFRNIRKDGLDLDGGSGLVSANRFVDCEDEAVDLSGDYDVDVVDNDFFDSHGGRVAADRGLDDIRARNRFGFSHAQGGAP